MGKKCILLAIVLVFGSASMGWAKPSPFPPHKCLHYDGFVWMLADPAGALGSIVSEDTGVFVSNPNPYKVRVWYRIFDKDGIELVSGRLLDHFEPLQGKQIPARGYGWISLAWALDQVGYSTQLGQGREKFTFQITMGVQELPVGMPPAPHLELVVEVKQVIYQEPSTGPFDMFYKPFRAWTETSVETWAECPGEPLP